MDQLSREQLNELADKWLKGTLTPEERELLDQWYDIDAGEPMNWTGEDDKEEELESRLLAGIRENRTPVRTLRRRRWLIPAAAVLLITLGAGTYFYLADKAKQQQTQLANLIRPGGNKAILTLANGKQLILNNVANGLITNSAGITVTKTANGQLTYTIANVTPVDAPLAYNTIEVPVGGKYQVILPDGTKVWLDAATKLRYPERFTGTERKVELITGQAYFEVNYNAKMPFRVITANPTVEDLGTHFNIMAYPGESIKTTLLEGSVKISNTSGSKILIPGQQARVTPAGIAIADHTDLEDVTAWKDDYFKFNESLETIMNKISRWYNVQIDYQFKPDPNLNFGGKISRTRNIAEVLRIMEYTGKVHFKIEGRRVIVMQ
jgi:transmembrane sensor